MISQLERKTDTARMLHLELLDKPLKKPLQASEGPRSQHDATFQIGNEDAGVQPARSALRQFAVTQNNTSFQIGTEKEENTSQTPLKTSKKYFPKDATISNPPFGVEKSDEGDTPRPLLSPFKLQKKNTHSLSSAQKLVFNTPRVNYDNKERLKERLHEIQQSFSPPVKNDDDPESAGVDNSFKLSMRRYRTLSDPSISAIEVEELPRRIKKPDTKELHKQYFYQSLAEAEKNKAASVKEKPETNFQSPGLLSVQAPVIASPVTMEGQKKAPPSPRQIHKLTYESGDQPQKENVKPASKNAYKNFHHSHVAYGSDSGLAVDPHARCHSVGDNPSFRLSNKSKKSDPIALNLGYRYIDMEPHHNGGRESSMSSDSGRRSAELEVDEVFDRLSVNSDSRFRTTTQWVNGNLPYQKV